MEIIKKITERMKNTKPLDVLYKKGKITFEEAVDFIAADFASSAFLFYDASMKVKREVENYNKKADTLNEAVESLLSGDKEAEGLNRLYLSTIGKTPQDIKEFIEARNTLNVQGGILSYINYMYMCELAEREVDLEYLFERCFQKEVVAKANDLIPIKYTPDEYNYPDKGQLAHFWKIASRCHKAMYVDHVKCFNEHGFVTGENGSLLEIDHVKNLVAIDFKGLL